MMETQERSQLSKNNWEKLAENCSGDSIAALERSLVSLEAGAAPTPSFKLYGRTDVGLVTEFLDSMRRLGRFPQWMLDYEDTRVEKFGPQGGHAPWSELVDDFMLYKDRPQQMTYVDDEILSKMKREYGDLRCQMLSVRAVLKQLVEDDTIQDRAAGWNTFQWKKTDPRAQAEAVRLAENGQWRNGYGYVFSRYNKLKKRIFMPMPFSLMLKQAQYFVPFLEGIQADLLRKGDASSYRFWGDKIGFQKQLEIFNAHLNLLHCNRDEEILFVQRDFEKMDTTTASSQYENLFIPVMLAAFHYREMPDMREALLATTQMPIVTPTGTLFGDHGTASGAEVTNGGETVCNDYFDRRSRKLLLQKDRSHTQLISVGNGDDGMSIFCVPKNKKESFIESMQDSYTQAANECGFRIQADKWHVSNEFGLYCQNMYWFGENQELHLAYPAALILNSIINPEHEYTPSQWDKDYRDIDIIQKLDNGFGLPYYHELVDYVMHGTKYPLLGKDEQETRRILSKYDKYRLLQPIGENYNRRDWQIVKSPTVKYILSHR